jgi:hypothetical protein
LAQPTHTSWRLHETLKHLPSNITMHKERSMGMYLSRTNNKLLTHGTQLQLTPLDHESFCSHHILQH